MATKLRPEISTKNKYWISRQRYYELRHFCMQYREWRDEYRDLTGYPSKSYATDVRSPQPGDPTERLAERRLYLKERMELVEQAARNTDEIIGHYIFRAVTHGYSYEHLRVKDGLPCCKNVYYDLYRKFFWLLDQARK